MNKKLLVIILCILISIQPSFSQEKAKKIEVVDDFYQEAIPNAHIEVRYNNKEKSVFVTDRKGKAKITLKYPRANLIISSVGYQNYKTRIIGNKFLKVKLKEKIQNLNPIVITGQFSGTKKENAVQNINVISRDKIQKMGANALNDVLTNEAGIRISQDPILGSGVSLQGVSGENVKILINGVPVIGRTNGNIDLSQVNLNTIERIEIIEGPMSVSYGSNALGGVINLITRKNNLSPFEAGARFYWENIGRYNIDANFILDKNNHHFMFSIGRYFFDGWNPKDPFFVNPKPIADQRRVKLWKPKEQYLIDANHYYREKKWKISSRISYMNETVTNRGTPKSPYNEKAFDDFYFTQRIDVSVDNSFQAGKHGKVQILAAYNDFIRRKNTYLSDLTTIKSTLLQSSSSNDTTKFKQLMSRGNYTFLKTSSKIHFRIGYDLNFEGGQGKRILNKKQNILDLAFFTNLIYKPIKNLTIKLGLRYAYNSTYKTPVLPSIHIQYRFLNKFNFRISYARGFRAPSIKELYFNFVDINHNIVGNPNLKAETSNNINASLIYKSIIRRSFLSAEVSGFYNQMTNLITLANTKGTAFSYANVGEFKTWGLKAQLRYRFKRFSFTTTFSNIARFNLLSKETKVARYSHTQDVTLALGYNIKKLDISFNLFYKYQGILPSFIINEDGEIQQRFVNDFHNLDLNISKSFWKKQILFTIGVKNLFHVINVQSNLSSGAAHNSGNGKMLIAPGRVFFTSIQFNINQFKSKKQIK